MSDPRESDRAKYPRPSKPKEMSIDERRRFLQKALRFGVLGAGGVYLVNDVSAGDFVDPLSPTVPEAGDAACSCTCACTCQCDCGACDCNCSCACTCEGQCQCQCDCGCGCECSCNCGCACTCDCHCECVCPCACSCVCSCACPPGQQQVSQTTKAPAEATTKTGTSTSTKTNSHSSVGSTRTDAAKTSVRNPADNANNLQTTNNSQDAAHANVREGSATSTAATDDSSARMGLVEAQGMQVQQSMQDSLGWQTAENTGAANAEASMNNSLNTLLATQRDAEANRQFELAEVGGGKRGMPGAGTLVRMARIAARGSGVVRVNPKLVK